MKKAVLNRMIIAISAALVLCLILVTAVFDMRYTAAAERSLAQLAGAFALGYDNTKDAKLQADGFAGAAAGIRVTVIAADGTVVYDTDIGANTMGNHLSREEIREAEATGTGVAVRASSTIGTKLVYAAAKTQSGQYVRVSESYASVAQDFISLLPWLLIAFAVALVIAAALARRFALSVTQPLCHMRDSLKAAQDGTHELDDEDYTYPELKSMAKDINEISREVAGSLSRLERERTRVDYILDNMNEGFVMLDDIDNILLINTAACISFDCERSAVRGKHLLHATRNIELVNSIALVHTEGTHKSVELSLPEGRMGEANISKVQGEGGVIIIISDITERMQAAKVRSDFFESASHELKTPITSISGFAELLSGEAALSEQDRQEIFARIAKESRRMSSLIADIIMISRLESGDIMFEEEALDIGDTVREVCEDARSMAQQCAVELTCTTSSLVRTASRKEISELVSNLVQNAIKYNKQGGRAEVTLSSQGGKWTLSVFNTGEPIAPEYRARIFERFYRIDKSRSKAVGGTGLGLAIVKHIAGKYGLEVKLVVTSDGNRFIVTEH